MFRSKYALLICRNQLCLRTGLRLYLFPLILIWSNLFLVYFGYFVVYFEYFVVYFEYFEWCSVLWVLKNEQLLYIYEFITIHKYNFGFIQKNAMSWSSNSSVPLFALLGSVSICEYLIQFISVSVILPSSVSKYSKNKQTNKKLHHWNWNLIVTYSKQIFLF